MRWTGEPQTGHGLRNFPCTAMSGRTAQEVPLGHGDVDWLSVLGSLAEIDYRGWLVIERNGSNNPLGDITAAVRFLRGIMGPAEVQ